MFLPWGRTHFIIEIIKIIMGKWIIIMFVWWQVHTRVVLDLVELFTGFDHVLYLNDFFSSMELALELIKRGVSIVCTIKADSWGLPEPLKGKIKLAKGDYVCITVGEINCFAYHDRKVVRFITNVVKPTMHTLVPVRQSSGLLIEKHVPSLLSAYNKFMGTVDWTGQLW